MQYNIKREPAKISALSSAKIDKYEYLTGQEILLSGYFPTGKVLEKDVVAERSCKFQNCFKKFILIIW